MDFRYKSLLQSFFSIMPKGESINYMFQKHITRSLPPNKDKFIGKVNDAFNHYENFTKHNELKILTNKYYEFGAGWTLTIPLAMSFLGFEVFCIDIRKLIVPELIIDTLEKFAQNKDKLPFKLDKFKNEGIRNANILEYLRKSYSINYHAPMDARRTSYKNNSFDFISSTATLQHIPPNEISLILKECYRILNKGGIFSITMDYQDNWSYFDKSISIYNFLKYSSKQWKKYNPSLHFQNRMRHSDYMKLISHTDFEVVKEVPRLPSDMDKKVLKNLKIANEFENYDFDDLAIRGTELVLIK
jgi:SAM-dependent methyltransferase